MMGMFSKLKVRTDKVSATDDESNKESPTIEVGDVERLNRFDTSVNPPPQEPSSGLKRGLNARHVAMIAIGGALGTGLVVGTGQALAVAGPGSLLISYTLVGILVYVVMCALGEMAAWLPIESGFCGHAARFCDPALGFALGYTYWFKYAVLMPSQLTAAALVVQYWVPPEKVNPGVFITVFMLLVISLNYFGGVESFGEFQFVLSSFKIIVVVGLIILSAVLALGGRPNHDRTGFRYWSKPGAFREYKAGGSLGQFLAVWRTMVTAVFAYLGTELIGVTAGEAQNPRRVIPRAIKLTFWRILIFYVLSVFLLGLIIPYNSEALSFSGRSSSHVATSASPFVAAVQSAGIRILPAILNACFLLFILSAANSDSYTATRTIYGLASDGRAPRILKKTNRNMVPVPALCLSSVFGLLAFLNVSDDSAVVFTYLVSLVSTFGLLTWISILVAHIFFVRARRAQGVELTSLPYHSPFGMWGSYAALAFCILIVTTKNFEVFMGNSFDYKTFLTGYLAIPLFLGLLFGYKVRMKTSMVRPREADLFGGKAQIDREEAEFVASQKKPQGWYRLISWLF